MNSDPREEIIREAAEHDIEIKDSDFKRSENGWTLDDMDPREWLDEMLMD